MTSFKDKLLKARENEDSKVCLRRMIGCHVGNI